MTTEAETTGWSDLNTYSTTGLLAHLDHLRKQRAYKEAANLIIEVRTYELRIAAAERMLAIHNRRATEAEDQRAAEERRLTEERVREVVREAIEDLTDRDGVGVHRARVADRVAKVLAGSAVSTEQRDRIVTIADEAFGLGPVETLDATLTRIERGIHDQHRRLVNLETQREADLREAFVAGCQFAVGHVRVTDSGAGPSLDTPTVGDEDDAAAEYVRSKAGG